MANEEYKKTFLQSESLQDSKDQLEEVYESNPDAIIIVEEEGKECIIEHGKQMNFVPSNIDPQELAVKGDIPSVEVYPKDEFESVEKKSGTIYIVTK